MQPLGLLKDVRLFNDDLFIPIDINARLAGFVGGATSGFILGAGNSIVANGWNLSAAFNAGVNSMVTGAITGAVIGGAVGGISAYKQGNNIWTGKAKPQIYQPVIDTEMMESIAPRQQVDVTANSLSYNIENNSSKLTPYEKGEIGVQKAIQKFKEEGGVILQREVSLNVDGVRIRADFVGMKDGIPYIYEVKNGAHARFTINQNRAIPNILNQHLQFIPFGKNAMSVPAFKSFVLKREPFTGDYKFVIKHYW